MRILLVKPPFARLLQNTVYITVPLGPMLVAAMLRERGHEVAVHHDDFSAPGPIPVAQVSLGRVNRRELEEADFLSVGGWLRKMQPDVVGLSYCTVDADTAYAFAHFVREHSSARLVAGGVHPSLLPEEELRLFDAVVVGEGDHPEAARAFEDPEAGIVEAPAVEDLDHLRPYWDCLIRMRPVSPFLQGMIWTQRGCPYSCAYCAAPKVFGKRVRLRDPGSVREEVESLPTREGRVIDDSFGVVRQHGLAVCKELAKTGFRWVCDAALRNLDREMVEALVAGGCRCVNVGLESASPRWRALSGKQVDGGEAEALLEMASASGLRVVFYLMIGFPGETVEELRATLAWGRRLKERGAKPHVSIATPYPGTRLWDLVHETHFVASGWSDYFHQSERMGFADCTDDEWREVLAEADLLNA